MYVLRKTASHIDASRKASSHKIVSRNTSHDTTEYTKKPDMSTSGYITAVMYNG